MGKKLEAAGLNPKQLLFCKLYASDKEFFGNGVESYAEAYNFDLTARKGNYEIAKSAASRLLTNVNVLAHINELLEEGGLNDAFVDKQLHFVITQNAEFSSKVAAIREYNKLKQRITDKQQITHILPTPILNVLGDNSDKESLTIKEED